MKTRMRFHKKQLANGKLGTYHIGRCDFKIDVLEITEDRTEAQRLEIRHIRERWLRDNLKCKNREDHRAAALP